MKSFLPATLAILTVVAVAAATFMQSDYEATDPHALPTSNGMSLPSKPSHDLPSPDTETYLTDRTVPPVAGTHAPSIRQMQPSGANTHTAASLNPETSEPPVTHRTPHGTPSAAPARAQTSEVSDGSSHGSAPRLDAPNGDGFSTADLQLPPVLGASAPAAELVVPRGAVLPAAFLDPAEKASPAQVGALDRLANDFVRDLTKVEATTPSSVVPLVKKQAVQRTQPGRWDAATRQANERYRQLFGVEAYNARTAAAARDALTEK